MRAGLFPWAVCAPGLALGLAQLARDLRGRREKPAAADAEGESAPDLPPEIVRRRTIEICLWIAVFWLAIWLLGFSLATLVTTFLYLRISARERWTMCLILTACAFAFVYGLFEKGLGVPLTVLTLLLGWLILIVVPV